ncbi:MAG: glycosyltransferase family 2 protein [Nibricoccus sp.]
MQLIPQLESWVKTTLSSAVVTQEDIHPTFERLDRNIDRIDNDTLLHYRVLSQGTAAAFLTEGKAVAELHRRTELFQSAYPEIACHILGCTEINGIHYLLTEYFEGARATAVVRNSAEGTGRVLQALQKLTTTFANSLQASTSDAARAELHELFELLVDVPFWTEADRNLLRKIFLPIAERLLLPKQPTRRVTNGDFTLDNLLLGNDGNIKLIDYEQAAITHFHFEDWFRLSCWNAPKEIRDFASTQIKDRKAAQVVFTIRQIIFEATVIHPEKARASTRHWAAELRQAVIGEAEIKNSLLWNRASEPMTGNTAREPSRALDLFHYARHMANQVGRLETKIAQMQQTFSWRSTAWLRAVRRKWLDPRSKTITRPIPPPAFPFTIEDFTKSRAARLHHHLDTSNAELVVGSKVQIVGWVFATEKPFVTAVRARTSSRLWAGEYGLDRPEIAEKFLPQATSRFSIEIDIAPEDCRLDLEAMTEDGEWLLFFTAPLGEKGRDAPTWASSAEAINSRYEHWISLYDSPTKEELLALAEKSKGLSYKPKISLVMPVYNPPEKWLARAIRSVIEQTYPFWELCIADDASTEPHVRRVLDRYVGADDRIKLKYRTSNGHISVASNSALELATGEYVGFLDHDDELAPYALSLLAEILAFRRDVELVYSDEDKIGEDGKRFDPHFKPDWNPDLLASQNYISHFVAYRTTSVRAAGGFRAGCEGCQDWDLALRISEKLHPSKIAHIPRLLYHWRAIEGSTAAHLRSKTYAIDAARKVLTDHSERTGKQADLEQVKGSHWRLRYPRPTPPPLVTLVIPTRNRYDLLAKCVTSIRAKTNYPNFEFLIADNDSDDPQLRLFYDEQKVLGRFDVISCPGSFNFSSINNRAAGAARGDIIGFLNNDLEAISSGWLDELVSHAVRPDIGVVGAKLYYPDMRIQHAGVITGLGGVAGHAFKNFPRNDPGTPQFRPHVVHNVSAVTAACMVVRKDVFIKAGRFDEENLKVAFNDIDFCLRVEALGYRNLFTPFAELIHHESATRGAEDSPEKLARFAKEIAFMKQRWGNRLLNDAAYNPNLTVDTEDFAYAFPPRVPLNLSIANHDR